MKILAYLDPITGSALVQGALAGMAALGLGWQYVRKGANGVLLRLKGNELPTDSDSEAERTESL